MTLRALACYSAVGTDQRVAGVRSVVKCGRQPGRCRVAIRLTRVRELQGGMIGGSCVVGLMTGVAFRRRSDVAGGMT